jgi:hypothetical protein
VKVDSHATKRKTQEAAAVRTTVAAALSTGETKDALLLARSAWMCPVVNVAVVAVTVSVVRVAVTDVVEMVDVVVVELTDLGSPNRRKLNSWTSSQSTDCGRKIRPSWQMSCTSAVRERSIPVSVAAASVTADTMHCRSCSACAPPIWTPPNPPARRETVSWTAKTSKGGR